MKKKYLLGATYDHELVFAEFGVTCRNGCPKFTASFYCVLPFNGTDFDLTDYFENWLSDMRDSTKYRYCCAFDCCPSELAENLANECNDVRDALDCSIYPERYSVDGEDWFFESGHGGQYDSRNDMDIIINPLAYSELHDLWDDYHLKQVDEDVVVQVEKLKEIFAQTDEETWITEYIRQNKDDWED